MYSVDRTTCFAGTRRRARLRSGRLRVSLVVLACLACLTGTHAGVRGEICYLRETDGFWQVWVMNGKGRKQVQVTRSAVDKVRCTWTGRPGELLVSTVAGAVLTVNRNTLVEEPVDPGAGSLTDVAALPDGRGLLFSTPGAGIDTDDIWISLFDGSEPRRLTSESFLEHFPVACPDGKRIVYTAGRGDDEHNIFRLELGSGNNGSVEKLTRGQLYNFEPSCSASGAIAFSSNRSGDRNYEIWMIEPGGSDAVRLTDHPSADIHPSWSQDEKFIAFESTRDGSAAVYRLKIKGSKLRRLTPPGVIGRAPVWSHR